MKLPLLQFVQAVRSSYWFLPSVMALGAIAFGALMVWLDAGPAAGLLEPLGWYQQSKPEGARAVLSAIAGSMITVAGVVFSITIVAISYAASQYGPRILTNFMSDRGNQVTLGTFIATFVYSVVVLRTIQSGEQSSFVPQLALFGAMFLALCSLAVLIYFIHHVPQSIHVNHVVADIGRRLIASIDKAFPGCFGDPPERSDDEHERLQRAAEQLFGDGAPVAKVGSKSEGYIQVLDEDKLFGAACKHDIILCLVRAPGDFLYQEMPFALVSPPDRLTDEARDDLRGSYTVGSRRTPSQDLLFLIDELVDITARAMSTGVNDPYTAVTCVDWLTAGASEMTRRQPPSPFRLDDEGRLRLVAQQGSFREHIERGFGRMRPYVARDINAGRHTIRMLASLSERCHSVDQLQILAAEAESLLTLAREMLEEPMFQLLQEEARETRRQFLDAMQSCRNDAEPRRVTARKDRSPRRQAAAHPAAE